MRSVPQRSARIAACRVFGVSGVRPSAAVVIVDRRWGVRSGQLLVDFAITQTKLRPDRGQVWRHQVLIGKEQRHHGMNSVTVSRMCATAGPRSGRNCLIDDLQSLSLGRRGRSEVARATPPPKSPSRAPNLVSGLRRRSPCGGDDYQLHRRCDGARHAQFLRTTKESLQRLRVICMRAVQRGALRRETACVLALQALAHELRIEMISSDYARTWPSKRVLSKVIKRPSAWWNKGSWLGQMEAIMDKKLQLAVFCGLALAGSQALALPVEYGIKGGSAKDRLHRSFTIGCDNNLFRDPAPGARKVCSIDGRIVASEGGSFTVNFTSDVVIEYGANKTTVKELLPAHRYHCGNEVFGDPAPGARKSCYINGQKVADEDGYFVTPGPSCSMVAISYGARGANAARNLCSGRVVLCGNSTFGDPLVGVPKSCMMNNAIVAAENRTFAVVGTADCLCAGQPVTELNKQGPLSNVNGQ